MIARNIRDNRMPGNAKFVLTYALKAHSSTQYAQRRRILGTRFFHGLGKATMERAYISHGHRCSSLDSSAFVFVLCCSYP
jgi:hypothetical protein